jgi:hypothetical protein
MYSVVSIESLNNLWCTERVIQLMDESRLDDASAVASEWGYRLEGEAPP